MAKIKRATTTIYLMSPARHLHALLEKCVCAPHFIDITSLLRRLFPPGVGLARCRANFYQAAFSASPLSRRKQFIAAHAIFFFFISDSISTRDFQRGRISTSSLDLAKPEMAYFTLFRRTLHSCPFLNNFYFFYSALGFRFQHADYRLSALFFGHC